VEQGALVASTPVRLGDAADGGGPIDRELPAGPGARPLGAGPLLRLTGVDEVGANERAAALARRSIKRDSKVAALKLAVTVTDLTTLEGADTPGKVLALCAKARRPDPADPGVPPVAAVCVYPPLVPVARRALAGTGILVASVATAFPSGQASLEVRLADVAAAVAAGADEIDMVINRGAFLAGRYREVHDEIRAVREAAAGLHLKVILETGELGTLDNVRAASLIAMAAGADFVKTSTGKISPAATLPVALVMLEAIRDFHAETGRAVGFKAAGGIRTAKEAVAHLVLVAETLGPEWLTPGRYRLGASSLLNDILMQLAKQRTGAYQSGEHFTVS
jgi:deoxyribose-phosphate aldolase